MNTWVPGWDMRNSEEGTMHGLGNHKCTQTHVLGNHKCQKMHKGVLQEFIPYPVSCSGRVGIWHFPCKWTWNYWWHSSIRSRLMKTIVYFLRFTWRWLCPSLHSHWIIYKSNAIQSQKVRLISLNFMCPQRRSPHLNWLSGLLYDCGDNGESGNASREWFIRSISDVHPRRRWIKSWEHLFLLDY